jgi:hypothetical protein
MPTLDQHQSANYTKILYMGDSGSGKTGSLTSLLDAGYSFRILDMDNGLDSLKAFTKKENLKRVIFETVRDKYKSSKTGPKVDGTPKAFVNAMDIMTEWSEIEDPKCIFVLDSLSALGRAAFAWASHLNPTARDKRQVYGVGMSAVEDVIAMLTGDSFKMNVIVITHIKYDEGEEGTGKGFANALGKALGPIIPRYFNTAIMAEKSGSGDNIKRKIKTMPTNLVDLKIPVPGIQKEFPLESGLAQIFAALRGEKG